MKEKLNLQEIVDKMSRETGASKKDTEAFLRSLFDIIPEALVEDKILKISGLGAFKLVLVEKRESVNVNTKEKYEIPAHYKLNFIPDNQLKEVVNEPFSAFETVEISNDAAFDEKPAARPEKTVEKEVVKKIVSEIDEIANVDLAADSEEKAAPASDGNEPDFDVELLLKELERSDYDNDEEEPEKDIALLEEVARKQKYKKAAPTANADKKSKQAKKGRFKRKDVTRRNRTILFVCVIVAALLLAASYFWKGYQIKQGNAAAIEVFENEKRIKSESQLSEPETVVDSEETAVLPADTTASQVVQEPTAQPDTATETTVKPEPEKTKMAIIAKVTMTPGLTLTMIAEKYYNSKVFWVYLYEANKARIKNPNKVPTGTVIEVPAPEEYDIDVYSGNSVRKASALGVEILSSF